MLREREFFGGHKGRAFIFTCSRPKYSQCPVKRDICCCAGWVPSIKRTTGNPLITAAQVEQILVQLDESRKWAEEKKNLLSILIRIPKNNHSNARKL